jgi:hypothetical protein
MSTDIDRIYSAIESAETGHLEGDDKWIRTTARNVPGGSSAYGPVQINKAALTGPGYGDVGFSDKEHEWIQNKYLPQMDLFLTYGNEPNKEGFDPKYDYGGSGDFTVEDREMYNNMAKKLMAFEHDRIMKGGGTLDDFIQAWRGRSYEEDPRYYDEVKKNLVVDNVVSEQGADAF